MMTCDYRHIHVSLRSEDGRNIFAVKDDELKNGREGAANVDTKFISKEAEEFLAGILDGLPDGIFRLLVYGGYDTN